MSYHELQKMKSRLLAEKYRHISNNLEIGAGFVAYLSVIIIVAASKKSKTTPRRWMLSGFLAGAAGLIFAGSVYYAEKAIFASRKEKKE